MVAGPDTPLRGCGLDQQVLHAPATAGPDEDAVVQRPVGQLPWGHVLELLDKLDDQDLREWYAAEDVVHGWSRPVLAHQIETRLHEREAAASSPRTPRPRCPTRPGSSTPRPPVVA
ncbi:DUF1016 N-terminal domain-containing protein [Rathayibacter sp. VKM Ac-2803]|uniref:DUF1016 N-terminal domain-containing protein n=2 Tax=unclassified Rathayibacter TaxID=2609250 RepID=UPI002E25969D